MKLLCFILTSFLGLSSTFAQNNRFWGPDTLIAKFSGNRYECVYSNTSYNLGILLNGNVRDTVIRFDCDYSKILAIAEKDNTVAALTAENSGQRYMYHTYKKNGTGQWKWTGLVSEIYNFHYPPDMKYFDLFFLDINIVSMRDVDSYRKHNIDTGKVPEDEIFIINEDGTTEEFLKKREYKTPVLSNEQLHDMLEKLARKKNNSNNVKNQEKH